MSQLPTDKVSLGSRVVVEDERSGARETYFMVFGDAEEFDERQVTMASPIGRALLNKGVGEEVILKLPSLVRRLRIVDLQTIHQTERVAV